MLRYIKERNKTVSVWQGWMSHKPGGRQVCPDQTKAVKGQNSKTLVTAGTIKGPLPCPEKRIEKQSIFYGVKRKKIRKKTEKKRKETKEKGELVQWICTNRSVSLSAPSNLAFF